MDSARETNGKGLIENLIVKIETSFSLFKKEHGAHKGKGNCIIVLYEELVVSTESVMRKTMKFIGESFHPMMLDHTSGMDQIKVAPDGKFTLFYRFLYSFRTFFGSNLAANLHECTEQVEE